MDIILVLRGSGPKKKGRESVWNEKAPPMRTGRDREIDLLPSARSLGFSVTKKEKKSRKEKKEEMIWGGGTGYLERGQ